MAITRIPTDMIVDRTSGEKLSTSLAEKATKANTIISVVDVPNVNFEGSPLQNLTSDGTDQIVKYQRIARYLKSVGGGTLKFPTGNFSFSQFPLYDMVSIEGNGQKKTYIKALASSFTNFTYVADAPIQYVHYQDFTVQGLVGGNPDQHGFYVKAIEQTSSPFTGGLWTSALTRITSKDFAGSQWYFEAVDVQGDLANQFLYFEQIEGFRPNTLTSRCLTVKAQAGQFNFVSCNFDNGTPNGIGTNIDITESMCNFTLLTTQNADYAINVVGGVVNIIHPWFENVKKGITQTNFNGTGFVKVEGGHFANTGSDAGNGYIFYIGDFCFFSADDINSVGNCDNIYKMQSTGVSKVHVGTIRHSALNLPAVSYHTRQVSTSSDLDMIYNTSAIVNTGSIVKNINSKLPVNSEITLIAFQGNLTISTGGNIKITTNIVLNANGTITLKKIDLWGTWVIVGLYTP